MLTRWKTFLHLSWLFAGRLTAEARRWSGNLPQSAAALRVYYGHERIPGRHEYSGGAMIKFQDLHERFPNTVHNPNILYLANSALPLFPYILVSIAKRHGCRFVLNQNGVAYPGWHGPGWEKANQPYRRLLRMADYVVYQSTFCKESADQFAGLCQSPWEILANPVDTEVFVPAENPPSGLRILLAGSHQHWYRVQAALETLALVPEARLSIAGRLTFRPQESQCMEEIRNLAQQLDVLDRIDFLGPYSQQSAPVLMQAHHILLHTKYNDPCPRLVVEAMACGLPVVYSASGGVPELVGEDGGVGCVAPCDWDRDHLPDPEAMARALYRVAFELPRFSKQARLRAVQCFDVRPWLNRHEEIMLRMLARKL